MRTPGRLESDKELVVLDETVTSSGTKEVTLLVPANVAIFNLYVSSISGTLDISIYGMGKSGQERLLKSFDRVAHPTANLVTEHVPVVTNQLRVVASYTAACTFDLRATGADNIPAPEDADNMLIAAMEKNNLLLEQLIDEVGVNSDLNQRILNHLRAITEINMSEAEEF